MKQVKLIKRDEADKTEKPHSTNNNEPKVNTMMETVKDWVEQNRAMKSRSPRKQFTALFSS